MAKLGGGLLGGDSTVPVQTGGAEAQADGQAEAKGDSNGPPAQAKARMGDVALQVLAALLDGVDPSEVTPAAEHGAQEGPEGKAGDGKAQAEPGAPGAAAVTAVLAVMAAQAGQGVPAVQAQPVPTAKATDPGAAVQVPTAETQAAPANGRVEAFARQAARMVATGQESPAAGESPVAQAETGPRFGDLVKLVAQAEGEALPGGGTAPASSSQTGTTATTSHAPMAQAPTAQAPTAQAPTAQAPTAQAPTVQAPTAQAPTAQAPTAQAPTAQAPTAQAPTVQAPTAQSRGDRGGQGEQPDPGQSQAQAHAKAPEHASAVAKEHAQGVPFRAPAKPDSSVKDPGEVKAPAHQLQQAQAPAPQSGAPAPETRASETLDQPPRPTVEPDPVIRQVSRFVKVMVDGQQSEVRMQLHPDHLGTVAVKLIVGDGVLKANLVTQDAAVKAAIEANLDQLKSRLADQGITVEQVHVTVGGDGSFSQPQHSRQGDQRQGEPQQGRSPLRQDRQNPDAAASPQLVRRQAANPWRPGSSGARLNSLA
jgi:flagellar hook-length control protein FliK